MTHPAITGTLNSCTKSRLVVNKYLIGKLQTNEECLSTKRACRDNLVLGWGRNALSLNLETVHAQFGAVLPVERPRDVTAE